MCMIASVWIDEPLTPLSHSINFLFPFLPGPNIAEHSFSFFSPLLYYKHTQGIAFHPVCVIKVFMGSTMLLNDKHLHKTYEV